MRPPLETIERAADVLLAASNPVILVGSRVTEADAVGELVTKQTAILQSAARLLKPGGRLVYATCSVLPAENESIAEAFSAAHGEFSPLPVAEILSNLKVPDAAGLATSDGRFLRLWPHRHGTDGFFAAAWVKN